MALLVCCCYCLFVLLLPSPIPTFLVWISYSFFFHKAPLWPVCHKRFPPKTAQRFWRGNTRKQCSVLVAQVKRSETLANGAWCHPANGAWWYLANGAWWHLANCMWWYLANGVWWYLANDVWCWHGGKGSSGYWYFVVIVFFFSWDESWSKKVRSSQNVFSIKPISIRHWFQFILFGLVSPFSLSLTNVSNNFASLGEFGFLFLIWICRWNFFPAHTHFDLQYFVVSVLGSSEKNTVLLLLLCDCCSFFLIVFHTDITVMVDWVLKRRIYLFCMFTNYISLCYVIASVSRLPKFNCLISFRSNDCTAP